MGGVMRRYGLRFGLLGPPVLYTADAPEAECEAGVPPYDTVRSPKVRALLASLLLDAGRIVPVESLKDALWGGAPPVSAQASLHNHVTRLRRLLDDPERLRAVPPGYRLRVEHGELDVHVFERHVAAARGAHAARNWERVARECAAGLALWRGTPLSGLPADLGGYAFVRRLREARLLLLEWRYDAELALGGTRFERLVPELTALAADHPLREAYHRQLMLALHRTGRQAEALAVHRDLRARLAEELGIEPGPAIRDAHVEILAPTTDDRPTPVPSPAVTPTPAPISASAATPTVAPAPTHAPTRAPTRAPAPAQAPNPAVSPTPTPMPTPTQTPAVSPTPAPSPTPTQVPASAATPAAAPAPTTSPPAPATEPESPPALPPAPKSAPDLAHPRTRPAQLPPPPAHFTGRDEPLRLLHRTLAGGSRVVVLSGMAGVGKSALALHVAHALKERFSNGQLYLHLHGATPGMAPLTAPQALTALLRDLGTEPRHIPEHPDAASALLRTLLAPTRTLVVLDDVATASQVRPLLPAGPGCAVIVTSRSPLTTLDGAHRFPLGPLSGEDSAALLRAASGPGEGRAVLDAAHPLVHLTGRLPLALRVVAARLAARSALIPDGLAGQLADTESRLPHLEYDDLSVRRSLAVAHDALAASVRQADRDAALALRRIGTLDLPTYDAPLLARLTGTDEPRAESALNRLVDVALLEEHAYGHYTPHDLVRDFARELAKADGAKADVG